ncbi:hypothetical protein TIFTF001_021441 [Ficus carica]|uniref:Stachyose synthase n=1 Tax=Ficus carica TaxID=3494 RepID=A0AA88AYT9_FICCA|nr:hypothetical protein TIFTF001_021441 [Ficus carica]
MAPPNDPVIAGLNLIRTKSLENCFDLCGGKLSIKGVSLLSEVPNNVTFSPFDCIFQSSDAPLPLLQRVRSLSHKGGFLGFSKEASSDRLINSLGKFRNRDFLSIFRSALHPGDDGQVMICAESGSSGVKASRFEAIAYVHAGDNPYNLMREAYSALRVHLNTFRLLEEKQVPNLVDKFGWCTWDAFYLTVEPAGVFRGLKEFSEEGRLSPRFVIIDDGWQSINIDGRDPNEDAKNLVLGGTQMTARLYRFKECKKFESYKGGSLLENTSPKVDPKRPKLLISKAIEIEHAEKDLDKVIRAGVSDVSEIKTKIQKLKQELDEIFGGEEDGGEALAEGGSEDFGMKAFTRDLRSKFKGLDNIYVWHALCGAWGGVRPGSTHLNSKIIPCKLSPGLDGTMNDLAVVKIVEGGIGLVHPDQADDFYDSMHSYLSQVGITGVKVDVIHTLEYVSEEYGGRVELAKAYYRGLSNSLVKNFNGSGLISSMQQCNDFFFLGTKQISMGRVGDDFWFQDPNGDPMGVYWLQGVHMIHCAYNSMWMGQMIQPDWDMFQSDHLCAKFHAGSRAICGGPVYVSDSLGGHDFLLLNKLVYPDGTIPKCLHFALPTRDCLFKNPLLDKKTVLKIWNFNKYGGVIGAFNCQGAGWDPKEQRIKGHPECYKPISGSVHVSEIEWDQKEEASELGKAEEYVVHLNQAEEIHVMTPKSHPIQFNIKPSSFEIFSFVPIWKLGNGIQFAPIGLTNMFNSGGTIQELDYKGSGSEFCARVKVKGGGSFLAYSSGSPKRCLLNGADVDFEWSSSGKLTFSLPWVREASGVSDVVLLF